MVRGLAQKRCRHMFDELFGGRDFVFDWDVDSNYAEVVSRKNIVAQLKKQYSTILTMLTQWIGVLEADFIVQETRVCLNLVRMCVHQARGRIID